MISVSLLSIFFGSFVFCQKASCPTLPTIPNNYIAKLDSFSWKGTVRIFKNTGDDDKNALLLYERQCPTWNVDLDVKNLQSGERYMTSDVKTALCNPYHNVYDCNDVDGGNLLYNITKTDSCVHVGDDHYVFTLPSGGQFAAVTVAKSIFSSIEDITITTANDARVVFARASHVLGFFSSPLYNVTWLNAFQNISETEQIRIKYAANLFLAYKLIYGKGGKDTNDNCSGFVHGGIVVLCMIVVFVLVGVGTYMRNKSRTRTSV